MKSFPSSTSVIIAIETIGLVMEKMRNMALPGIGSPPGRSAPKSRR